MESSEEDALTLQFSLRYHPGRHAGLQLIHIDRRPDAGAKLGERYRHPFGVVFLAKACLHVNADAAKLVHEMPFLCDDVPKLVSYQAQTLLERVTLSLSSRYSSRSAARTSEVIILRCLPWPSHP